MEQRILSGLERYHMSRLIQLSCLLSGLILSANLAAAETEIVQPAAGLLLAQVEDGEGDAAGDATASGEASLSLGGDAAADADAEAEAAPPPPEPEAAPAPVATEADNAPAEEAAPAADETPWYKNWTTEWHGYVRAPAGFSIARRPDPNDPDGDDKIQSTYLARHLVDSGYDTFAFTRLQETEWAEILLTAKHDHIAATVALMGSYYQFVGAGNPNGSVSPGLGFLTLDTDFNLGSIRPNIALTMGAFLKVFGGFGIYDTYMFQRSHLMGEQVELTLPISDGFKLTLTQGFGLNKNGLFATPAYGNDDGNNDNDTISANLSHYVAAVMNVGGKADIGVYYNSSWTNDPSHIEVGATPAAFEDVQDARMRVIGADVHLRLPRFGHLWAAFSHIAVTNGGFLSGGIEVLHSPNGGANLATNYLPTSATQSGAVNAVAWLYENSLQGLMGGDKGNAFPDLTFEIFGMMASSKGDDVPDGAEDSMMQIKGGADVAFWPTSWMAMMLRYDGVNLDEAGKIKVITPRLIFTSHFLSSEQLWFQVSKYIYDDDIKDGSGMADGPDALVFKMQAVMSF
ncbi:MAG: hypothetical protein JXR76_14000 [Deltaproteobacteria bacterium]|nr:hypothetical protein [Deltaproteobacteria bacterium]